jgi:hypothetical protein
MAPDIALHQTPGYGQMWGKSKYGPSHIGHQLSQEIFGSFQLEKPPGPEVYYGDGAGFVKCLHRFGTGWSKA